MESCVIIAGISLLVPCSTLYRIAADDTVNIGLLQMATTNLGQRQTVFFLVLKPLDLVLVHYSLLRMFGFLATPP